MTRHCKLLIEEITARDERFVEGKYDGENMDREDLSVSDWDQHLLEELIDAAVYQKKRMEDCRKNIEGLSMLLDDWIRQGGTAEYCAMDIKELFKL